jgi:hypothetical protein
MESMEASQAIKLLESYDLLLVIMGLAVLASAVLPRLLSDKPLSLPIVLLGSARLPATMSKSTSPRRSKRSGYTQPAQGGSRS